MIYKYVLSKYQPTQLSVNENYMILDIQRQDAQVCVWIDVDQLSPPRVIKIVPVMTGAEVPVSVTCYFGTIQTHDGLVVHYYV